MALTILASGSLRMSTGTNVIQVETTTTGVYKFRFYLSVTYFTKAEATTKTITFTQPKNSSGKAIFNMNEIYKNIVTPMIRPCLLEDSKNTTTPSKITSIHNIPQSSSGKDRLYSKPYLENPDGYGAFQGNCNKAVLRFYEMYSTTADGIPIVQAGTEETVNQWVFYGRGERKQTSAETWTDYDLQNYTKKWLTNNYKLDSNGNYVGYIGRNQYMTMAFFNGHTANASADTYETRFAFYNSSGVQLGSNLVALNTADTGGKYGGTTGSSNTGRSAILFIGAGLENLDKINTTQTGYTGDTPSDVESTSGDTIAYYDMWMAQSTGAQTSKKYRFYVTTPCARYEETRLAYMNKFGVWEYINLNKEKNNTYNVKRDSINKPLFASETPDAEDVDALQNVYSSEVANQGVMVTNVQVEEQMTLYTQNLDDSELDRINDLILSPQIHLLDDDKAIALICTTNKINTKVQGKSRLYSYQLKFKFADPKYRTI